MLSSDAKRSHEISLTAEWWSGEDPLPFGVMWLCENSIGICSASLATCFTPVCLTRHKCSPEQALAPIPAVGTHISHRMIPQEEMFQWGFLPLKKVMSVSEKKLWTGQPCLTPWLWKCLRWNALLPWPAALVPTGHPDNSPLGEGSPAHLSNTRGITAGPTCPSLPLGYRSSLISPRLLQLCKLGNIIFHYAFGFLVGFFSLRHQKRKAFLCFHRKRCISPSSFTRQVKASNPDPGKACLTLSCKA